jgi:hypothetical protein
MSIENFKQIITSIEPEDLAEECLYREYVYAIPSGGEYKSYIDAISADYSEAEHIAIMGSGNCGFSLNPKRKFREFCIESDIDVVIVCGDTFHKTWEELRSFHRENYYLLNYRQQSQVKRNGENVYSGFITPKWISNRASPARFEYEVNTNKYSNDAVGYRDVNMMYFKNTKEAVDYYVRGFRLAKGVINNELRCELTNNSLV